MLEQEYKELQKYIQLVNECLAAELEMYKLEIRVHSERAPALKLEKALVIYRQNFVKLQDYYHDNKMSSSDYSELVILLGHIARSQAIKHFENRLKLTGQPNPDAFTIPDYRTNPLNLWLANYLNTHDEAYYNLGQHVGSVMAGLDVEMLKNDEQTGSPDP